MPRVADGRAVTPWTNIVRRLAAGMACLAALAPALAPALELGPIEARSALYEPLDATDRPFGMPEAEISKD